MNKELIGESWFNKVGEEFTKPYFINLKEKLKEEYQNYKVYPAPTEIFKAFQLTPFENVRVVMLLMDPYPFGDSRKKPHANGVALSSYSTETPASLKAVFRELDRDILKTKGLEEFSSVIPNSDLTPWCKEGVLLINTCLTVRAEQVGSHSKLGWHTFIQAVLQAILSDNSKHRVIIALGKDAKTVLKNTLQTTEAPPNTLILETGHPASASHGRDTFSGCNIFSKVNHFFKKHNQKEIEWRLKH
jgi:uracil-DNA glycosylase